MHRNSTSCKRSAAGAQHVQSQGLPHHPQITAQAQRTSCKVSPRRCPTCREIGFWVKSGYMKRPHGPTTSQRPRRLENSHMENLTTRPNTARASDFGDITQRVTSHLGNEIGLIPRWSCVPAYRVSHPLILELFTQRHGKRFVRSKIFEIWIIC